MNSATGQNKPTMFSKERIYEIDPIAEAVVAIESEPKTLDPPQIIRQQESNVLMRMNSGTYNEHTSSSLGKRNFKDF